MSLDHRVLVRGGWSEIGRLIGLWVLLRDGVFDIYSDVIAGAIVGILFSWYTYRQYYPVSVNRGSSLMASMSPG